MDWTTLLRLPMTLMFVLAVVGLFFTLVQLLALRQRLNDGRRLAAGGRALLFLLGFGLTLLLLGAGVALRGYRLLGEEKQLVQIDARILSPQRWALTLRWPDGTSRDVQLAGDDWRIEAVVLKWKPSALLAGLPPLYRLDRLSGRYDDATQEAQAPRTVIDLGEAGRYDLLNLSRAYPQWLPGIDTMYGSGAFLPLVDQGHYTLSLMNTGALVARPDEATEQKIGQPLGG